MDVNTVTDDDVLLATRKIEIAIVIATSEVAGREPSIVDDGFCFSWLAVVSRRHVWSSHL